jgi:hypothetical protein
MQKSYSGLLKKEPPNAHSSSKKHSYLLEKSRPASGSYSSYLGEKESGKSVTELLKRIEGRHRPGITISSKTKK